MHGAKLEKKNQQGATSLMLACEEGHLPVVEVAPYSVHAYVILSNSKFLLYFWVQKSYHCTVFNIL